MKKGLLVVLVVVLASMIVYPARAGLFSFIAAMHAANQAEEAGKKADRAREATERLEKRLTQDQELLAFVKMAASAPPNDYERRVRAAAVALVKSLQ